MPSMPEADFQWRDKVGHLFAFGFVQITHARALEFLAIPKARSAQIAGAVLSATLVGGLLEIWQAFLPHRSAEWGDLLADGVGAILAGILYLRLFRPDEGEGTS